MFCVRSRCVCWIDSVGGWSCGDRRYVLFGFVDLNEFRVVVKGIGIVCVGWVVVGLVGSLFIVDIGVVLVLVIVLNVGIIVKMVIVCLLVFGNV